MDELGKLMPQLKSFIVENKIVILHKLRLLTFQTEILHYPRFKNLSKNWEKYILHREELNYKHIKNSVNFW